MRSNRFPFSPGLFIGLSTLAIAGPARATVAWTSGFEPGPSALMTEWSPGINATKKLADGSTRRNVEVLGEQVYTGKYACKITVHPDDTFGQYNQDRVDIQHPSTLTGEGKDSWLSGHYYMPSDAMMRNEIGFYETKVSSTNIIDFWVQPKSPDGGTGTTLSFGVGFLGATVLWTGDFEIGKWHQIAVHVKWSQSATTGSVDFWLDGEQKVTAHAFKTKPDGNDLFFQTGLHRILPKNFTDVIYFDDFIEADTLAEAMIAAPREPGSTPDGGTDAAGGGGAPGTAGAGTPTGAAGASGASGATNAGGATVTGTGGDTGTAGAGQTTGAAGSGATTGAAGSKSTGTAGQRGGSGCVYAGANNASRGGLLALLALLSAVVASRRKR